MDAPGELDLATMLRTMDVVRRPGVFAYVEVPAGRPAPPDALAMIDEVDTVSYVVPIESPSAQDAHYTAAWLTLAVDSSLDAVGLTAAFAAVLAARSIPANVLAGLRHDHVLVPADQADDAIEALRALREPSRGTAPTDVVRVYRRRRATPGGTMDRDVRLRFWLEAALAVASLFLLVLTIAWPEWIEEVFGIEPDGGNGMAEWGIVVVFAVAAAALALTARREWRNAT